MAYPLATLAPTISSAGISVPSYNDIYQSLLASFRTIYGSDIYVTPDSQDGQWIAVLAKAIDDSNQTAIVTFNSMSPAYSQGAQLSSLVKINGLRRNASSNSTAVGNAVGVAGTVITNGVAKDQNGNLWDLPASVIIPVGGVITVTVAAQKAGDTVAPAGTINQIYNPQLGWQSFVSTTDAVPGAAVEQDSALRARREVSTAMPALTIKEAISTAIGNVAGVTRYTVHTNDTSSVDPDGVPANHISAIVAGGSVADVATAIASRKAPGVPTYGTTQYTVFDSFGLPTVVNFFVLQDVSVYFAATIKVLPGYVSTTGDLIKKMLADFVNALVIGEDVYVSQSQAAASLIGLGLGQTFYITDFRLGTSASPTGTSNIAIAFNQAAACAAANVVLTVT